MNRKLKHFFPISRIVELKMSARAKIVSDDIPRPWHPALIKYIDISIHRYEYN